MVDQSVSGTGSGTQSSVLNDISSSLLNGRDENFFVRFLKSYIFSIYLQVSGIWELSSGVISPNNKVAQVVNSTVVVGGKLAECSVVV